MSNQSQARRRAVRLTDEARQILKSALFERWRRDSGDKKLTREVRAGLLGVSVATSERVWEGKGVDRPTLTLAFKNLGLDWQDSYCVDASGQNLCPPSSDQVVDVSNLDSLRTKSPIWIRLTFATIAVLALCTTIVVILHRPTTTWAVRSDKPWQDQFCLIMAKGTESYHRAEYGHAQSQLDEAIGLARSHDAVGELAGALKLSGDLAAVRGSFQLARTRYEESATLWATLNQEPSRACVLEALGDLQTRTGDFEGARKNLTQALETFNLSKDSVGVAMAMRDLGSLSFCSGNLSSALNWFRAGMHELKGSSKPDIEADIRGRQALVLQKQGHPKEAHDILQNCLRYWTQRDHPRWEATIKFRLAAVEIDLGNRKSASLLLASSKTIFGGLGDAPNATEASNLLERLAKPSD